MSAGVWFSRYLSTNAATPLLGQRARDIPALVLHRQRAEAAAGRDDHRGAARLGRVRQERRERRDRDVARELAAVLAVPRFGRVAPGSGPVPSSIASGCGGISMAIILSFGTFVAEPGWKAVP